ncbi:Acyl-CoA ligase oryP [Cladobotryum mycophilum]|uniref:Acyl-CoA ligase oryP n=1 Tax=Cladobotryum mycophilum TaxID=491253 RepID=A0ABR0SV22_9HYPO
MSALPATRNHEPTDMGLSTNAYGSTEQAGFSTNTQGQSKYENSIGVAGPGFEVKLSEGDHGEILVKSPFMFTHYAGNEKATKEAFNEDGYYKSGDLAELKDGELLFLGRANNDFVFFQTYRIPTQTVEHAIAELPYVAEACVLSIPDHESKNLCAALVRLNPGVSPADVDLRRIRSDIADNLPAFMFPTLLRVLREGEEVPLTTSGKPVKKRIRTEFFTTEEWWPMNNPPADVESWADLRAVLGEKAKPWDWGGIQRVEA